MARSIAKIDRDTKPAAKAGPKHTPYWSTEESATANEVIDKALDAATATALWFGMLFLKGITPTALKQAGSVVREAIVSEILYPRLARETSPAFAKQVRDSADKVTLQHGDKSMTRAQWRNTRITKRMGTLSSGYVSFLAEDKGLMESDGKLVKLQGNNAGTPNASKDDVWSNVEARIAFKFTNHRLAQLAKKEKATEKGGLDKTDLAFRKCYEEIKTIAEPFRGKAKS